MGTTSGGYGALGGLETDSLADEDDVDPAGQFLMDLEDLPDLAVLSAGRLCAGVFQRQAVLIDPLVRGFQGGHQLLRADLAATVMILPLTDDLAPHQGGVLGLSPSWHS
jgi:hypothetical protein